MATMAFTVTAAAAVNAFPAIGQVASAAIMGGAAILGGIMDSQLIMPVIMRPPTIESGRIRDFNFHAANEGNPVHKCYGPGMRVPGTIIYLSDLQEVVRGESTKGMGQRIEKYIYYCDMQGQRDNIP